MLRFNNSDKSLLALIAGDMPDHLQKSLNDSIEDLLKVSFGDGGLKDIDSGAKGEAPAFPVLHFACYNRCSTKVRFLPSMLYSF